MSEEVNLILETTKESMTSAVSHLEQELSKVRAGRATPAMVSDIKVDYYGTMTGIPQVANVNNMDNRTLSIQPWEKNMLPLIEKAIFAANIGITPQSDGEIIRLTIPPLTEERRRELAKKIKALGEDAKVSVRSTRKDANDEMKALVKDGLSEDMGKTAEASVQNITKGFGEKIDKLVKAKEDEVMTI